MSKPSEERRKGICKTSQALKVGYKLTYVGEDLSDEVMQEILVERPPLVEFNGYGEILKNRRYPISIKANEPI